MKCIICGTKMSFFFTKSFHEFNLETVEYWKCESCGFCASKTHFDLSDVEWAKLNDAFHQQSHFNEENPYNRNQRYFNQAQMLSLMTKHQLIKEDLWLDWGCGRGAVSKLMNHYFNLDLMTYDKYFTPEINVIPTDQLLRRHFELVLNTAVFEHVRDRATLDEIESYVSETGCLAIHTLVPENIPQEPNWMYLLPVHCAFHTNHSMQKLMLDWGYTCSVYNPHAKLWVLFKTSPVSVQEKVQRLNTVLGWEYLHFKVGFMDYWK